MTVVPLIIWMEPEPSPFQIVLKMEKVKWNGNLAKIINVLDEFYKDVKFEGMTFKRKRDYPFSSTVALTIGIISFFVKMFTDYAFFSNLNGFLVSVFAGLLAGVFWGELFRYIELDWIDYNESKDKIILGFESESKAWLITLSELLKDEGVELVNE